MLNTNLENKDANDDSIYEWDETKRIKTLEERGLDFKFDAKKVFNAKYRANEIDNRKDYGEKRTITAALVDDKLIVIVWTERGLKKRIISMRYGHGKERKLWESRMGR